MKKMKKGEKDKKKKREMKKKRVRVSPHDPHGLKAALSAGLQAMILHINR
jgi:hypothetical protein